MRNPRRVTPPQPRSLATTRPPLMSKCPTAPATSPQQCCHADAVTAAATVPSIISQPAKSKGYGRCGSHVLRNRQRHGHLTLSMVQRQYTDQRRDGRDVYDTCHGPGRQRHLIHRQSDELGGQRHQRRGDFATVSGITPAITATTKESECRRWKKTATFTVSASGNPTPTYQWSKNAAPISGATGATYTTPVTVLTDTGAIFTVVATNSVGSIASNPAMLTVTGIVPTITAQPQSKTVTVGATATFSVTASGTPAPGNLSMVKERDSHQRRNGRDLYNTCNGRRR